MKFKSILLFLLLLFGFIHSQTITIDLSTGKNDDGTLMSAPPPDVTNGVSVPDSDWSVIRPGETTPVTTRTRHTYTGWSYPTLGITGNTLQSRWITDVDGRGYEGDGYYYYYSKSFTVPNGVTDAKLNLRSLSFVRNWTYLVRTDVTPNTEELITQTTWMSDGAKGWLNTRSPEVINKTLVPGTYMIKVKLYTNSSIATNSLNVHSIVRYTPQTCATPVPQVNPNVIYCQNVSASALSATGDGLLWYASETGGAASTSAPVPSTATLGSTDYWVSQTLNGCESSRVKISVVINPNVTMTLNSGNSTQSVEANTSIAEINYTLEGTTNATVSSLPAGVTHTFTNNELKINGTPTTAGTYNYSITATGDCGTATANGTITVTPALDWTLAPNSYIFTGKAYNPVTSNYDGIDVDGLYIPVKKAYAMWNGKTVNGQTVVNEFMKDDTGNATPIPTGNASAGLYWEDIPGLIKSVTLDTSEGSGENARIKVVVNKLLEGNAVISYKVNNEIYWTWHIWVTDDPTSDGSTYHLGTEKNKDGNSITNWKWMDRNLGATHDNFVGNDWHKSAGLQYQWGRKDPFPTFQYRDFTNYGITGEINMNSTDPDFYTKFTRIRGSISQPYNGLNLNTNSDTPNGNVRFSVKNPINYIVSPIYIYKSGETPDETTGENYMQKIGNNWTYKEKTNWFSKNKFKTFDTNNYENNIAWDLWGDTRGGKWSNVNTSNPSVKDESSRYNTKSSFDPCPCGWRVPSFYSSVSAENNTNPWGINNTNNNGLINLNLTSSNTIYPNIKIFPLNGFDFTGSSINLGKIPVNGNYEFYPQAMKVDENRDETTKLFKKPEVVFQDITGDGGLHSSTFMSINNGTFNSGPRSFQYVSDPTNINGANSSIDGIGTHLFISNRYDFTSIQSAGVRCIKDPNITQQEDTAFKADYIPSTPSDYSLETLKSWTKEPNAYVEYTNATLATPNPNGNSIDSNKDNDRIIEIPLRKAYAMYKLYFNDSEQFPTGDKSSSIVWTTNKSLISSMVVDDKNTQDIYDDILKINLSENQSGNAVVALHIGNASTKWNNGEHQDPVIWSWHIWAPESVITTYDYTTESVENGGIVNTDPKFILPTKSKLGVQLKTTFMDRDLGSILAITDNHYEADGFANIRYDFADPDNANSQRAERLKKSGGLHYQWGRKDPFPVFYNAGGYYETYPSTPTNRENYRTYAVFSQNGNDIIANFSAAINNTAFITKSKNFSDYSQSINLSSVSPQKKTLKVIDYSVRNPFIFMYQTNLQSLDWVSDTNGLATDRWGHATSKSPYDPCPAGYRIPDIQIVGVGLQNIGTIPEANGQTPWYYHANFTLQQPSGSTKTFQGIDPSRFNTFQTGNSIRVPDPEVFNRDYNINQGNYLGGYIRSTGGGRPNVRYGFIFDKPNYSIGKYANNGIRGFSGGNSLNASFSNNNLTILRSGLWTSAMNLNSAIGAYFNVEGGLLGTERLFLFTPSYLFRPQAAMSCRCAKIQYDANGNEIGRYDPNAIPVPLNSGKQATTIFAEKEIEQKVKSNDLVLYPNPVSSVLYINANDDKEYYYQIYNMSGQLVKKGKFENKQTNVSELISGVYLVRVNDAEKVVKIIKN